MPPTSYILKQIIASEFQRVARSSATPPRLMLIRFTTPVDKGHEGYAQWSLVLYGPSSHVQVWVRKEWEMVPKCALGEEGKLLPGWDYVKGATAWRLLADHDSAWSDAVGDFVLAHQDEFIMLHEVGSWYSLILLPSRDRNHPERILNEIEPMTRSF